MNIYEVINGDINAGRFSNIIFDDDRDFVGIDGIEYREINRP